jgi:hypothetical protein
MTQPSPARPKFFEHPRLQGEQESFLEARESSLRGRAWRPTPRTCPGGGGEAGLNRQSVPREQCYLSFVRCKDKFS